MSSSLVSRRIGFTPYRPTGGGGGGGGGGGTGLLSSMYLWGFSTARKGLGTGSNSDWLERVGAMASNAGVPVASLKAAAIYHDYNGGFSANVSSMGGFQFVVSAGIGAILMNQRFDGGDSAKLQSWADGGYDGTMQTYLNNVTSWCAANNKKAILVFHHEPENDTTSSQAQNWAKGQARWVKLAYDHDDPSVIACVNLMFDPGGGHPVASDFDFTNYLLTLCSGNAKYQQSVLDRTLLGLDPYPEFSNGNPGKVINRIQSALDFWRSNGLKNYYLPEVGLFHWNTDINDTSNPNGVIRQTDVQIAQRHHDNFCVDLAGALTGNGTSDCYLRGASYFDSSDWTTTNYRSPTREFGIGKIDANGNTVANYTDSMNMAPKTLAHYAQVILGTPHARPS